MKNTFYLLLILLLSWSNVNLCQAQTLIRQDGNVYIEDSDGEVWRVDTTSLIVYVDTLAMPTNVEWKVNMLGFTTLTVPANTRIEAFKDSINTIPYVHGVDYDICAKPATSYNDSLYSSQWYLTNYRFDSLAAAVPTSHKDIIIALIEGGVNFNHPDLGVSLNGNPPQYGALYVNTNEIPNNNIDDDNDGYIDNYLGWNFYTNSGVIDQTSTHGMEIFGLIGAKTNNYKGTAGLIGTRNDIKIMVLCVDPLVLSSSCIANAIIYAANHGANIINMSFTTSPVNAVNLAIAHAKSKGVLMVASAGNTSSSTQYPANDTRVLGVSSVNSSNVLSSFSSYGSVDVAAPGENIYVPTKVGYQYNYVADNGTSFAAPMVSTLAAYIMAQNPFISAKDVRCIIDTTAVINPIYQSSPYPYDWDNPMGDQKPYCSETGFGTIQPKEAIKAAKRQLPYINFYEIDSGLDYHIMYFNLGNSPDNICHEPYLEEFPNAEYTYSWEFEPLSTSGLSDYYIDDFGDWFACHFEIDTNDLPVFHAFILKGTIKDLDGDTICIMGGAYLFDGTLAFPYDPIDAFSPGQIMLQHEGTQEYKQAEVVVYSIDKRVVHQETIDITNLSEIPLDLSSLKNGYYFVKVYVDGENVLNKKVFKVR